ncbi:hypothetical protein Xoosp13_385 [Xanthomonas phage Xoo-sp13]|nr:hypothetical protein Xoosp13_385 [Xanthomonas phage Xoo-sp13]
MFPQREIKLSLTTNRRITRLCALAYQPFIAGFVNDKINTSKLENHIIGNKLIMTSITSSDPGEMLLPPFAVRIGN